MSQVTYICTKATVTVIVRIFRIIITILESTNEFFDVTFDGSGTYTEGSGETGTTIVTDSSGSTTESDFTGM